MPAFSVEGAAAVAKHLRDVHIYQAAGDTFGDLCAECLEALQDLCTKALDVPEFRVAPFDWTPDVRLELFGSTVQGTALRSSDLDVRMSFEQFAVVHEPHRQLRYLRGVMDRIHIDERFSVVRMIDEARLPVLRLKYKQCLEVDLTMGCELEGGAEVDRAVRDLLDAAPDDGARRFVRMVKVMAKAHNLISAYTGYLNSLSWVFLALNFLQAESALPPYRDVVEGKVGAQGKDLWAVRLTPDLFIRFFAFVEDLGSAALAVSVFYGNRRFRSNYRQGISHPLLIENPCRPRSDGINLAAALTRKGWQEIRCRCEEARGALAAAVAHPQDRDTLLKWFFDPCAVGQSPVAAEEAEASSPKRRRIEGAA